MASVGKKKRKAEGPTRTFRPQDLSAQIEIMKSFARDVPPIRPLLTRHQKLHGKLMPFVFLGDIARWVGTLLKEPEANRDTLEAVFRRLEKIHVESKARADSGDEASRSLIEMMRSNFLYLLRADPSIRQFLGPQMRARFDDNSDIELCHAVVEDFPELRPELEEHVAFNQELLAHVFFGDVVRWVESLLENEKDNEDTLRRFFILIESRFGQDDYAANVIAVSLLESLWDKPQIRKYLSRRLLVCFNEFTADDG